MNSKVYDILKWVAIVLFPALVTCTITILTALGYENTNVVAIILGAVETFLGSILGVSSISYFKNINDELTDFSIDELDDGK